MPKHVVLDSIARSGTTLMSALLRSQEKTMSFCPGFNEPLSCRNIAEWPHGVCRQGFLDNPDIDFDQFQNESLCQIVDYSQYYGLSESEWRSIIFDAKNPGEVRSNIEKAFPHIEVFCYRWNQTLCYFYDWIEYGKDYLWLTMIRHPLDRAVSSIEKHKWQLQDSLRNTLSFLEKLGEIKHSENFKLIYYELLVSSPTETISDVYNFFDLKLHEINLTDIKGSNGEPFVPQSSQIKNVYEKKDGYLTRASSFSGLYKNKIGRWKDSFYTDTSDGQNKPVISNDSYETFEHFLASTEEYSRYF